MGRHSSTWGCTFVLPPPPKHGTFCSCGVWECDKLGVYCDRLASWTAKHDPLSVDLLAAFDAMASGHRAAARARAEGERVVGGRQGNPEHLSAPLTSAAATPRNAVADSPDSRCAENVGKGAEVRQCSFNALPGSAYCGRHPAKRSSSDDFESAPAGLDDVPDNLPW